MPKFEKGFVHFMWSDELEGKKVFYADDIHMLIEDVTDGNDMGIVKESEYSDEPFDINGDNWKFVYFDPCYELKLAYEQGRVIQAHVPGDKWVNIKEPSWADGPECYRIKPGEPKESKPDEPKESKPDEPKESKPDEPKESKPITNRELSRWLAQGNGECKQSDSDMWFSTYHYYWSGEDNTPAEALVRKWGDPDWHEPSRQYMGF